jgi:multiple sugar transport system substrate-binding protein
MKKITMLFAVTVLISGYGLYAAGSSGGRDVKTVNLWYWSKPIEKDFTQLFVEFEQANPGIKISPSLTPFADYWTKLQTALPTGTGPDIFLLNHPNAVSYIPTGLVKNLEPWAEDIHFENFDKNFCAPYTYQGKRYAVPFMWDTTILFYNKSLFDKAGLAYPNEEWTWKEFFDAARKLTIKNGNVTTQYGVLLSPDPQQGVCNFIYENGGKIFSDDKSKLVINNPEAREAVQTMLDLIYKEGVAPTPQLLGETNGDTLFQSGNLAMMPGLSIRISFFAETLGQNLQVAPMVKQKERSSIFHNMAYAVAEKTKCPEETRKFLAFMASRRHAEVIAKTYAPCYNGMTDLYFKNYPWVETKYVTQAVSYGHPLPISSKNGGAVYTLLTNELAKLFASPNLGNGLANLENVINAEIAK